MDYLEIKKPHGPAKSAEAESGTADTSSNTVDINKKRGRGIPAYEEILNKPEIPPAEIKKKGKGGVLHMKIVDAFRHNKRSGLPSPRCDLRLYESEGGNGKIIFSVDANNVARERKFDFVVNEMAVYRRQHLEYHSDFCDWIIKDIRDCAKLWFSETEPEDKPAPFAFKEDPTICFHRVEFHIDVNQRVHDNIGATIVADELIGRMSNNRAAMAYLASMIIEKSFLQQYMYIYGDGGDGKGALIRAFKRFFGAAAYTKQRGPRSDDKHYGVSFNNKRLVAFTDSRDPAVVRADYVMALTGDDGLEVEPKGGHGYNIPPYCKLVFLSNVQPSLINQLSEIRRLIYVVMSPRPLGIDGLVIDDPKGYEASLWAEMPEFIKKCLNAYWELCPTHGAIPQDPLAIKAVAKLTAGQEADNNEEFFNDYFVIDLPGDTNPRWVSVQNFNRIIRLEFKDSRKRTAFKEWLFVTKGIQTKGGGTVKKLSNECLRVFYGFGCI